MRDHENRTKGLARKPARNPARNLAKNLIALSAALG